MVNKKVVIICTIIAIVVTALIVAIKIKAIKEYSYENEINLSTSQKNVIQNQVSNEVNQGADETQEDNTIAENEIQKENTTRNETTYQGEEESKDDEIQEDNSDSVIDLVKNEWGEDDTVYYTIDNQSGNLYTVSVRSKITTETLAEYEVDSTQKTVVLQ